jgi:citrate synthase
LEIAALIQISLVYYLLHLKEIVENVEVHYTQHVVHREIPQLPAQVQPLLQELVKAIHVMYAMIVLQQLQVHQLQQQVENVMALVG